MHCHRNSKFKKIGWAVGIAIIAAGAASAITIWYNYKKAYSDYVSYRNLEWPAEIQINVLGRQLTGPESLYSVVDEIKMGQGTIIWKYKIDPHNKDIVAICAGIQTGNCKFYKYSNPKDNVDRYVRYESGFLIVQEAWR